MTSIELELFLAVPSSEFNTYWIPCTWFINLLKEARQNHRTPDPQGLKLIMEEFNEFRTKCGMLWSFDWISIPLVYTQVVTLATYSFFAVALIARQYIDGKEKQFQLQIDIYVPVFTILQFFFFMGLLKVAEQLINPFGDDDEDFELNWIIDRHTKVSYLGVDTLMNRCPPLVKDIYFDNENLILPYTEAAAAYKKKTYRGSVANMTVPEEKQTMFLPDVIEEDEEEVKLSHYTSTISLATHNESPLCQRRQISQRAETPTKTDQTCPETIVQFDIQEPTQVDQTDRSRVTDAMRRISNLGRHSASQIDHTRKPFFMLTKSPKMVLRPSSSTSTLSKPTKQIIDTPTVYVSEENPWREYTPHVVHPLPLEMFASQQSPDEEKQSDFESSQLPDTPHSDTCQSYCHHTSSLKLSDTNLSVPTQATTSKSTPKYIIRRHKSMETGKKKGSRWKKFMRMHRKGKVEDIMVVEEMIPYTRSSPNLKHLDKAWQSSVKDTPDDDTNSSSREE